jgi:hypothetical protein
VFAQFQQMLNHDQELPKKTRKLVYDLCFASAASYFNESDRRRGVRSHISKLLLPNKFAPVPSSTGGPKGSSRPDDRFLTETLGTTALRGVTEEKLDLGVGKCSPQLQAGISFAKHYAEENVGPEFCCLLSGLMLI